MLAAPDALGTADRGTVIANPLPVDEQVDPALHARLLQSRPRRRRPQRRDRQGRHARSCSTGSTGRATA